MLLSCSSCNSKYLINSADLKPNGRMVRCANCLNEWFQDVIFSQDEEIKNEMKNDILQQEKLKKGKKDENYTSSLPSTIVIEQKPKLINSILILLLLFFIIFIAWYLKSQPEGLIVLFKYYLQ